MATQTEANDLIRWMEVPHYPNVFALGNFARQVTFASQQTRAFNLITALFETNRLKSGSCVAVVGAGVGGLSAVAAALENQCSVDLYEQASQPCPMQRGNDIRFIHPNILRWPDKECEKNETDFPFLNWTAANVRGVVRQIDLQWQVIQTNPRLRQNFNYKVSRLYVSPSKAALQRPWLSANRVIDGGPETASGMPLPRHARSNQQRHQEPPGYIECAYDCIILAVGFGDERALSGVPFLSYWENDSLHQEAGRERRSILVSGCGDGGLIDALRLRLRNFDHAEFVNRFLTASMSPRLIEELLRVDAELRPYALAPDISIRFQSAYNAILVEDRIERYFRSERRADTSVTLNSPAPGPLSFQSSLLNRYSTYLAMRYANLHYLSGKIVADRATDGRFKVTLQREDVSLSESQFYDHIIVRHGPESAIRQLLPAPIVDELRAWWQRGDDITLAPRWATKPNPPVLVGDRARELALTIFSSAYRILADDRAMERVQSVAVGEHDGKTGFIVSMKSGSKAPPSRLYAGVLVQYVVAAQPAQAAGQLAVPIGVGIYNYDASERLAKRATFVGSDNPDPGGTNLSPITADLDVSPIGTGTLGCFAKDERGTLFLISSADVLSPARTGQPGDRIFVENQKPSTHTPIAILMPLQSDLHIAYAKLESGVKPNFKPISSPLQILKVGGADVGDHVVKVGRTTGATSGTVTATRAFASIATSNADNIVLSDCIEVTPRAPAVDFHLPGDAGALLIRVDGVGVGILIAGFANVSVALPLEPALSTWKVTLLPNRACKDP